jgi:predicted tellurium resistance membrane protein TerC
VEHLPMLTAASTALLLCAASVGFLADGVPAALGAAGGVAIVTVGFTMSTLVIAWADTVRPALVMPLGLLTYVAKIALIGFIVGSVAATDWPGRMALLWGMVAGVLGWTSVQIWWVARSIRPVSPQANAARDTPVGAAVAPKVISDTGP